MIPPTQHLAPGGGYPIQPQMQQTPFSSPIRCNSTAAATTDECPDGCSYTTVITSRNQSALPNMGMGPPPSSIFWSFWLQLRRIWRTQSREHFWARWSWSGPPGGGHQRRHSLALPEAKKAAEIAQQKRTTSGFQFPIPGAAGATPAENTDSQVRKTRMDKAKLKALEIISQRVLAYVAEAADMAGVKAWLSAPMEEVARLCVWWLFHFLCKLAQKLQPVGQAMICRDGVALLDTTELFPQLRSNWRNQPAQVSPTRSTGHNGNFQSQQSGFQPDIAIAVQ